jgi:hypothetical protein
MKEPQKAPMTIRYALGWWAALVIIAGPVGSRANQYETPSAIFISLSLLTLVAYVLARIGWARGWFRKQ